MLKKCNLSIMIVSVATIFFVFYGFACNTIPDKAEGFMTLKRFNSIPMIARTTVFSADGNVSIYDPPDTKAPFTFRMTTGECDSLKILSTAAPGFDTLYYNAKQHIPNPSVTILAFTGNGVTKSVRISQYPPLPPALSAILSCAGTIEARGLEMMQKIKEDQIRKQQREQNEEQTH